MELNARERIRESLTYQNLKTQCRNSSRPVRRNHGALFEWKRNDSSDGYITATEWIVLTRLLNIYLKKQPPLLLYILFYA